MSDYWNSILNNRISRRRAIVATGATAASAAFLAACGGSDQSSSGEPKDASGLRAKVEDTTSKAKSGGTWINPLAADVLGMDPYAVTIGSAHAPWGYSRLVRYNTAKYPESPLGDVNGDGAESWEMTPDGLRFTFKLRGNLKLDPRPPTSGRMMNAQDVMFSANKFKAGGVSRGEFFNSLSPNSPVESVEAPDARTVVVKMAFPKANMISSFAFQRYLWMMPVEADGRYDPKGEMRGSGAWRLEKWDQSVAIRYERNSDWHLKPVYFDKMEQPIVSEYAARRAQLVAGNVLAFPPAAMERIIAEDIIPTKKEQPKLNLYEDPFPDARPSMVGFSFMPNSPFHDTRVRRAASMLLDRETFIDAFYNVSNYKKEGLDVDSRWHTHFAAGEPPYWTDPKGKDLGEGAQYFQLNVAEAKKLMQAAGHNSALKMPGWFSTGGTQSVNRQIQVVQEMMQQGGMFAIELSGLPTNDFNNRVFNGGGLHEGLAMNQGPGVSGDIDNQITVRFNVTANPPQCLLRTVFPFYTKIQSLIDAQRKELDDKKRLTILSDLQKEMAVQMPAVPWPGIASSFSLAWPQFANYNAFAAKSSITAPSESYPTYWLDESKKP
jgi:ABC-type transport system substrate-binding protein